MLKQSLFKCLFYFKRSTANAFVRYHNNDNLFLKVFGLILFISGATKSTVVALSAAAGAACGPGQ
jgi:hypothetical protein